MNGAWKGFFFPLLLNVTGIPRVNSGGMPVTSVAMGRRSLSKLRSSSRTHLLLTGENSLSDVTDSMHVTADSMHNADEIEEDVDRILHHFHQKRHLEKLGFPPVMVGYHQSGYRMVALSAAAKGGHSDGDVAAMLLMLRVLECHSVLYAYDTHLAVALVGPHVMEQIESDALIMMYAHPAQSFLRAYEYDGVNYTDRDNPVVAEPITQSTFHTSVQMILGMDEPPPDGHIVLDVMKDRGFKIGMLHGPSYKDLSPELANMVEDRS